jgi:hypothetical protein
MIVVEHAEHSLEGADPADAERAFQRAKKFTKKYLKAD